MQLKSKETGFTFIEMMIAMTIGIIVLAGVITTLQSQQEANKLQNQVVDMQQGLRASVNILIKLIRMAGFDPEGKNGAGLVSAGNGQDAANALTFTMVDDETYDTDGKRFIDGENDDDDGDGVHDEKGELATFSFYLYDSLGDGDLDLGIKENSGNVQALAENIMDPNLAGTPIFTFLNNAGAALAAPFNLSSVAAIRISLTAEPDVADHNYYVNKGLPVPNRNITTTVTLRN